MTTPSQCPRCGAGIRGFTTPVVQIESGALILVCETTTVDCDVCGLIMTWTDPGEQPLTRQLLLL